MAKPSKQQLTAALIDRHGHTYAEELGIDAPQGKPAALFQLLCASILFSARIDSRIAVEAARGLKKNGWTSPKRMAESSWQDRVDALDDARYVRYDESTATTLGELAEFLLERWSGDLRRLREEAERDPEQERKLLKQAKGIGDVGVDIFFREAQAAWTELRPFADRRALDAARELGLGAKPDALARLVDEEEFARLTAALVRVKLAGDYDEVRRAAREGV